MHRTLAVLALALAVGCSAPARLATYRARPADQARCYALEDEARLHGGLATGLGLVGSGLSGGGAGVQVAKRGDDAGLIVMLAGLGLTGLAAWLGASAQSAKETHAVQCLERVPEPVDLLERPEPAAAPAPAPVP